MSQPIRRQGGHLVFLIGPKNTNLVENVEILLPVNIFFKFHSVVSEEKSKMWNITPEDEPFGSCELKSVVQSLIMES